MGVPEASQPRLSSEESALAKRLIDVTNQLQGWRKDQEGVLDAHGQRIDQIAKMLSDRHQNELEQFQAMKDTMELAQQFIGDTDAVVTRLEGVVQALINIAMAQNPDAFNAPTQTQ